MFGMNLGWMEFGIILVIVLVLFGAKRIPGLMGSIGDGIRQFKRNVSGAEVSSGEADTPIPKKLKDSARR